MGTQRDAELGTLLGVWGHPDDEAYLAGGLMAVATDAGRRVVCVTATRGEAGFPDGDTRPVETRMAVREAELQASLEIFGVTEHHWLGYRDGACHEVPLDEPVATLVELIDAVRPDTVLTFGPDGMTGHVDHIAVSRWTTLACRRATRVSPRLLYATSTQEWNDRFVGAAATGNVMMNDADAPPPVEPADLAVWYELDDALTKRKVEALLCQASQIGPFVERVGISAFHDLNRDEFFRAPTAADWPE